MILRNLSAVVLGGVVFAAPVYAAAADRGPSTPEERKRALDSIHRFAADPLNPALKPEIQWIVEWVIEIPDLHIHLCSILDKLPKGDKKDSQTLFTAMVMAQTEFVIQNPDQQKDNLAEH